MNLPEVIIDSLLSNWKRSPHWSPNHLVWIKKNFVLAYEQEVHPWWKLVDVTQATKIREYTFDHLADALKKYEELTV